MDEKAWASGDKLSPVFDWVKPAKKCGFYINLYRPKVTGPKERKI